MCLFILNLNKKISRFVLLLSLFVGADAFAQPFSDTAKTMRLPEVSIQGVKAVTGMGYMADAHNGVLYAAKKTEVILLDSLVANTAQNNPRQVLGRVPGAIYSETEGGGFPSHGIGFRGLDPSQSAEVNVRQNGYNLAADVYGYPESYYLPPLEAVERIEVTRGAGSLQFGPQFGGVVNYVLRQPTAGKPLQVQASQQAGSFGNFSSYLSIGGQKGKVSYMAFGQYRGAQGWRPNSDFRAGTGYAQVNWQATRRLKVGLEYTALRNRIHMPGGLSDAQYANNPNASFRARNWITTPWNLLAATAEYELGPKTRLFFKTATNLSNRNLVWRNEDGGPASLDTIVPQTGTFVNREVSKNRFRSQTTEIRLLHEYTLAGQAQTLSVGVRGFYGTRNQRGGGRGTTGSDFDLTLTNPRYGYALDYSTTNGAVFAEQVVRISEKFKLVPGVRAEFLRSTVKGYKQAFDGTGEFNAAAARNRTILLAGIGAGYKLSATLEAYGNITQAYRPIEYSSLSPQGSIARVDPDLKDAKGYNADAGVRGHVGRWLHFDVSGFWLQYNRRIGTIIKTDPLTNQQFPFRTNVAASQHKGIESYVELHPMRFSDQKYLVEVSAFNSLAYIDARYSGGEFAGKFVEYAPRLVHRMGLTTQLKGFAATYSFSSVAKSYGDAANSETPSADAVAGVIPAYTVQDIAGQYTLKNVTLKAGCNNLLNNRYFTKRADEYPGPGIIPAQPRSFYVGVVVGI